MPSVVPPSTVGMLGGGQLGRYTLMAARQMGYGTAVLDPDPSAPAGAIADLHLIAAYDDDGALDELAERCAVVTTEFENPPAASLARLADSVAVAPDPSAVAVAQDRRAEKRFLGDRGFPVGPFAIVEDASELTAAVSSVGTPAVLKTAGGGYDGKGQLAVAGAAELVDAWQTLGGVPCVLERRLELEREVSVVVGRERDGHAAAYEPTENLHVDGILDVSVAPATLPPAVLARAVEVAGAIAEELDYVGVLAVEMFVVDGEILVNELAPRPHNSGHWTLDAATTSQFAQQLRAVCGLPLGSTAMTAPAVAMANLLGDCWAHGEPDWRRALEDPTARLHLYGKAEARPGRKMGHLTAVGDTPEAAQLAVERARDRLTDRVTPD